MTEKYTVRQLSIGDVLGWVSSKNIAIPEIQRPFVWDGSKVRDLIDSLYNGYPTGYLIIWQKPNVKMKNNIDFSKGAKILIDGQQRVTALMASILGVEIINKDYNKVSIKIAFNPFATDNGDRFMVQTPIHYKDKRWIPDISDIFKNDFDIVEFTQTYCENNPEITTKKFGKIITCLKSIANRQIGIIELDETIDIDEVTEIFKRINSQGKPLNQADFAMSTIAADEKYGGNVLRKAIDYFCHLAVKPEFYTQISSKDKEFMDSEYAPKLKWLKDDKETIYDPNFTDMLRVAYMHKFGRAKLKDLVSLLSGRNFETRSFKESISEGSFALLKEGTINFMKQFNFEQFVLAIKSAGFISDKLINSQMTMDFAYTLFLTLMSSDNVPKIEIKRYVQKWYILTTLTSRYISSPETYMESDIKAIKERGFVAFFNDIEDAVLSDTFWDIGLVQNLETSAINSPYFNAFLAAQIHGGDRALFSSATKVTDLISVAGDVHHIFPREYLKQNGIDDRSKYNQVANYVYLDTQINISIGKKAPSEYFKAALDQCSSDDMQIGTIKNEVDFYSNLKVNCIPQDVVNMTHADYEEFLLARRKLMAAKIKAYYQAI